MPLSAPCPRNSCSSGIDIRWYGEGKIVDFKVTIRPWKAIQKVHAEMGAMLEGMKKLG